MQRLQRTGIYAGLIAPWWWAAIIACCASLWPHYSHTQQFISELGAHGSPTQTLMNWAGFYIVGILYMLFGIALVQEGMQEGIERARGKQRPYAMMAGGIVVLTGIARLGTGYFPCEAGCNAVEGSVDHLWHHIFARIGYGTLTLACLLWGIDCWKNRARHFAIYSFTTVAIAIPLLLVLQNSIEPRVNTGLYQRLVTLVLSGWIFVLACRLRWIAPDPDARPVIGEIV